MAGPDDNSSPNAGPANTSGTSKAEPQKMKKYGFRLTPEEQELAYELKANMMRKLDAQNEKLETEILLNEKLKSVKKAARTTEKPKKFDNMSLTNALKLMKMYERKAKEAEVRIKQLEEDLERTTDLAKRYRDMNVGKGTGRPVSRAQTDPGEKPSSDEKKITDCDLNDDEALFRRHVARLAETRSMKTTAPIRVQDVIRKNEVLLEENSCLMREVQRLKEENDRLMFKTKHANSDKDELLRHLAASEDNRRDLMKRLEKEQKQSKHLSKSLTRQASEWMQLKKDLQYQEDRNKLISVAPVSVLGAEERTWLHPAKKNVFLPRKMLPVEQYASANQPQ